MIVDATFGRREERQHFAARSRRLGVRCTLIVCEAPIELLRARIAARAHAAEDPSDADQAVLEWQFAHQDALDESEQVHAIRVDTQDLMASKRPFAASHAGNTRRGARRG